MEFAFDDKKNELLLRTRGVGFHDVIEAIADHGILLNFDHPDQSKYPGQKVLVIEISGYTYCVPYAVDRNRWFMKTVYPNRKFRYLLSGGEHEEV